MIIKTYSELIRIPTFEERLEYLRLEGYVGDPTFGLERELNQAFYSSSFWKNEVRPSILIRDGYCDLACEDHVLLGLAYVHHIEPLTIDDILSRSSKLFDPNNLITVSRQTHDYIHYGHGDIQIITTVLERQPGDTKIW